MSNDLSVRFALTDDPEVTVVVLTTGEGPHVLGCLRSVADQAHAVTYEVVLVLNGATDALASAVARRVSGATVIRSRVNRGFSGGCNLGVSHARGRFVALLNDDAVVTPGWLDALVEAMAQRPKAGAVGSRLLHADGSLQEAGQILWADGSTSCVGRDLPAEAQAFEWARRVDYCSGSSLLVRKATWDELGGLDETFFPAYCEDVDLCLRIAEWGQEVWYEPRSVVRHLRVARSTSFRYKKFLIERNRRVLVSRWGELLAERVPPAPTEPPASAAGDQPGDGSPDEAPDH